MKCYLLDYYNNDYRGIGLVSPSANIPSQLRVDNKQLFNGNISSMGINIPQLGNSILYNYQYDQLNRLVSMNAWKSTNSTWGGDGDSKSNLSITENPDNLMRQSSHSSGRNLLLKQIKIGIKTIDKDKGGYTIDLKKIYKKVTNYIKNNYK